ncbi:permease prefix domain 1-containing protein [Litchfieldia alkalitelluris]|uniref:permease prefix domain 1-containing protein n=1 Tax=Litchfieldia alkalitelluris TaxID=304268 RepID=UPI0009984702|nr:permease prefix domain 1-containing protein [Litchfieldia alkalitelluris]
MKSKLERYVENIVHHTESSKKEKEDLYEELLIHLQISRDYLIEAEGLTSDEAEERAMQLFGQEGEIGSQIQQALFPYRKELMLTLSISSIIATISIYLLSLFVEGDAYIGWLCYSMVLSSMLLFLPLNQHFHINKKFWINGLLIFHTLGHLYGWLIVGQLDHSGNVGLTIWVWLNIALSIVLVYWITTYDYGSNEKYMKLLHGLNIASGIIVIGISLFLIIGGLIMIGEFHFMMVVFACPIAVWTALYMAQVKLAKRNKKAAFVLGMIPIVACIIIFVLMYGPVRY